MIRTPAKRHIEAPSSIGETSEVTTEGFGDIAHIKNNSFTQEEPFLLIVRTSQFVTTPCGAVPEDSRSFQHIAGFTT